ncbi:MAG: hypothetical protein NZ898_07995, partial [Myxococcota bacterium]|nr:hypothetical protein [Myxococcota bacterium]
FVRSGTTWTEEGRLNARDGAMYDSFGQSVALTSDGSRALVGAPGDDIGSRADQGSAYVFVRSGTTWTEEGKLTASDEAHTDFFGSSVALTSDGSRALVGVPGDDVGTNPDQGSAYVFVSGLTDGEPCTSASQCLSGFCVDGVCCESACGGGASDDCQACSTDSGGSRNGRCTALVAAVAPMVTCRRAAGPCDAAETCTAASSECPEDRFAAAGTMCRAATCADGVATSEGRCSGLEVSCPEGARMECAPYICGPSACRSDCATSADCVSGFECVARRCQIASDGGMMMTEDGGHADAAMEDGGSPVPRDGDGADAMRGDAGSSRSGMMAKGCGCRVPKRTSAAGYALASMLVGLMVLGGRRRRERR